jgi:hypothetical protein
MRAVGLDEGSLALAVGGTVVAVGSRVGDPRADGVAGGSDCEAEQPTTMMMMGDRTSSARQHLDTSARGRGYLIVLSLLFLLWPLRALPGSRRAAAVPS